MLRSWREERGILRFCDEQFHVELDAWQEEALMAIASPAADRRRIALQACVGPGKTAVLSWGGLWFLTTQGDAGEHPRGLVTSITSDNLRDNLMAEFDKWRSVSPYCSEVLAWTSTRIFAKDHPNTWFIGARSWPKTASPDQQGQTFSGLHSKYVYVAIDESGNIPVPVLRAADQALARVEFGKVVQGGNPTSLEGMLYAAAGPLRGQWFVIRITGDPDDPKAWVHSPRVGPDPLAWAKEQIAQYGRDNPWVMTQILGKFPPASINALLGIEEVEVAMHRKLQPHQFNWQQKRLGVDVARFGDDRSVIWPRQGLWNGKPVVMRNARTTDIAARVAYAKSKWNAEVIFVDDTGHWGHGVIDNLLTAGHACIPLVYSAKAIDPRYFNRRAEMWFQMAEAIKKGAQLPNIPELVGELTTPTYTFHQGAILLEEKDQVKKRLGRSPDLADACAETYALPDMPSETDAIAQQHNRHQHSTKSDFNPYQSHDDAGAGVVADFDPYAPPEIDD